MLNNINNMQNRHSVKRCYDNGYGYITYWSRSED